MRELCVPREEVEDDDGNGPRAAPPLPRPAPPALGVVPQQRGAKRGACGSVSIPDLIAEKIKSKTFFWSVELIPGTSPHLQSLLDESLEHLAQVRARPAFASVTWHVDHLQVQVLEGQQLVRHPALELCARLQDQYGIPALMHLAAGRMRKEHVRSVLESCLAVGVRNILALRGDYQVGPEADFQYASDLVHFIRKTFGTQINIGVAGYPSGHPDTKSQEINFANLKEKVKAGADFILTQMVSSAEEFHLFRQECDNLGMKIPIIPGLFLIQSYKTFEKLIRTCNIIVSDKIVDTLKELQNENNEKEYGECIFRKLVEDLMEISSCPGTHIFSMNRVTAATKILDEAIISHNTIK